MNFERQYNRLNETLFIPVLSSHKKHWTQSNVSFVYCYDLVNHTETIVGITHNDCSKGQVPTPTNQDYVYNSKYLNNIGIEAKMLIWLSNYQLQKHPIHIPFRVDAYPIMLWLKHCRDIKDEFVLAYLKFNQFESLKYYDDLQRDLSIIEKNGLWTNDGFEYSEYNPYTLTGRPSNHFNNINYAALNKTDGSRERFVSRFGPNGKLIEFDLKAFHIYLLSKVVGYDWPDPDIYAYFGKLYPPDVNPKDETFKQIYGGISDKYLHIDFFFKVKQLTNTLFERYEKNELKSVLFERQMNIPDLTNVKVLNYILQSLETEFNASLISKINDYLYTQQSKLVLYTYDSFLIDYCKDDGKNGLDGLKNIFSEIPYRIKYGNNYLLTPC